MNTTHEPLRPCPIDREVTFSDFLIYKNGSDTFRLVRCQGCSLVMIQPPPSPEVLNRYYTIQYYGQQATKFIPVIQWLRRLSVEKKIRTIERLYQREAGHVLDIGSADGSFLFAIKKRKWNTTGIEISESFRQSAFMKDINVLLGDVREQHFPDHQFEVITLWHVFEHLAEPDTYVKETQRIIAPGGLFVLTLPNIESWQSRLFGRYWFHLDPPRHLFHYSPKTLTKLLEQYGFTVKEIHHFSLEYNPYGYVQSILNIILKQQNALYDAFRNVGDFRRFFRPAVLVSIFLLPLLILPSIIFSIVEAMFGAGGTIKVYARASESQ